MKRANHLIHAVFEPKNLRLAFWKARKGRNYSTEVMAYRENLDKNLLDLRQQLMSGLIQVGEYRYFKIYDPKEREICASAFREQVLHHAMMNICHDYFDRYQIYHSYACRLGKGTYAALETAKKNTRKFSWYLKLDVRKFFRSIHHEVLKSQLRRRFKDQRVLDIFEKIVDSFENEINRGLPIGNLTSQYFANHYLAELDHYIKEHLKIKAYVRYMDDMVLWHNEKSRLLRAQKKIERFVEERLYCQLKPEILNQTKLGLSFLGYRVFPFEIKLTQRSKQRFIKKIKNLERNYQTGLWSEQVCQRRVLPLLAFTMHADAKNFRKSVFLKIGGQSS